MTRKMTASEVKAKLLAILNEVANGEQIEITRHGHIIARLVPAVGPSSLKGRLSNTARTACSEEDLFSTSQNWNAS